MVKGCGIGRSNKSVWSHRKQGIGYCQPNYWLKHLLWIAVRLTVALHGLAGGVMLRGILAGGLAVLLAGCTGGLYGNGEFDQYVQRKDTVTMEAGDAVRTNAVAQTLNPWPAGVGDRRIPANGARMEKAIECYQGGAAAKNPVTTSQTTVNVGQGGAAAQTSSQTSSKC